MKLCVIVGASGFLINTLLLRCLLAWMGRVRLLWLGAHPLARVPVRVALPPQAHDCAKHTRADVHLPSHKSRTSNNNDPLRTMSDASCITVGDLRPVEKQMLMQSHILAVE